MDITVPQLASECAAFMAVYPHLTWDIEATKGLPPGLLLAVGSRETNLNLAYAATSYGNGGGIWQWSPTSEEPQPQGIVAMATLAATMLASSLLTEGVNVSCCIYNAGSKNVQRAIAGGQNPNSVTTPGPGSSVGDYGNDCVERLAAIQVLYSSMVRAQITSAFTAANGGSGEGFSQADGGPPAVQVSPASQYSPGTASIPGIDLNAAWTPYLNPADWQWPYNVKGPDIILSVCTDSNVDLTVGTIPQIQLTVIDPDFSIMSSIAGLISQTNGDFGPVCRWKSEVFVLSEVQTTNENDVPATILTLSSAVLAWMQTQRYVTSYPGSATKWITDRIADYNASIPSDMPQATFLGEPTRARGANPVNTDRDFVQWLSFFDYATELAEEEGMWLFETNGGVIFGEPSWISSHSTTVTVGWPGISGTRPYALSSVDVECMEAPVYLRSQVLFTGDTLTLQFPRRIGEQMRCGQVVAMVGAGYIDSITWVVQEVTFAIDGGQTPVQVTCNQNKFVRGTEPGGVTPASPETDPTGVQIAGLLPGTTIPVGASTAGGGQVSSSVSRFVSYAKSQAGLPYKYGTEDPGTSFDCSGLVQWALSMVGISAPRTSQNQYPWIQAAGLVVSVAEAEATYGALLFGYFDAGSVPGYDHVVISLGNGTVFQAAHTGTNLGISPFYPELTAGGLVPGLDYSASISTTGQPTTGVGPVDG